MLTIPEVLTHRDVVVFPDDEDPNLFYVLAGKPHLRLEGSTPVFRALFWTDAADGSAGSVAGVRGALLHFDVNLAVSDDLQQEIGERIRASGVQQARQAAQLKEERERLERQARARGEDPHAVSPQVPEVGPVRFGSVQFLGGNVTLLEEKSGGFVEWSSAGGPPSLIGDNNSAFALRLGAEGAAVWYRALEQDAAAIGVRYELKFQTRLPSLQIHVWAGSHQSLEMTRKVDRTVENQDQGCSDADVERINVHEVTEKLLEEGLVNIEIIKGSAKISDENVSQLRNSAMNLISDRVKEILQHRIRGMTEEERRSSLVEKVTEEVNAFAELRLTQRDVIEWAVNPQATITDFLGGLTGDARKHLITLVDLSDPIVATLEVPVSVDAAWTGDPAISSVVVRVEYAAAGDDAVKEVSFDKDKTKDVLRWRRARRDRGTVRYSAKAFVHGAAEPIELPGAQTNGAIQIQVPNLGSFKVRARTHPDMFALQGSGKITAVQLDYSYKDEGAPDHVSGSIVLRKEDADAGKLINHTTFRQIDRPLQFQPTYFREHDPEIRGPMQQVWMKTGEEALIEIPTPWHDFLRVGAVVPPGIEGLARVKVDVVHRDEASDFESGASLEVDSDGDWEGATWVVQSNKENQRFLYRYSVQGKDQLTVSPWVEAEGDQTLVLSPLAVHLRPERLELGTTFSEAVVRLSYADPGHSFQCNQELFLTKDTADPVWLVPRVDPNVDSYHYSLTLFPPSGDAVEVEGEGRGANLLLRAPAS